MTYSTDQRTDEESLRDVLAKPPPPIAEGREAPLFQTMDELHVRHGNVPAARDRLYLWGGGFLIGLIVFGALYLMILFLE